MAGGLPVLVPLLPPSPDDAESVWGLDFAQLEAAITPRTRLLLLNTPHNPTGTAPA
jgi:N-succinyldiaminopimelate aminotransferase